VELAELQDREVGDGTTSVVIIAAELLKVCDMSDFPDKLVLKFIKLFVAVLTSLCFCTGFSSYTWESCNHINMFLSFTARYIASKLCLSIKGTYDFNFCLPESK